MARASIMTYLGGKPVSVQNVSAQPTGSRSVRSVRRSRFVSAVAAATIASGLLIGTTACGAGQIAQTANQAPAINGNEIDAGPLALRDVHIVFPKDGSTQAFVNGGPLEMAFLIANGSPDTADTLESISFADGSGEVEIEGKTEIGPNQSLRAGEPALLLTTSEEPSNPSEERITVTVTGAPPSLTPGLTVPMVFDFEKAGQTTIEVPVDAGAILPRQDKPRGVEEAEGEAH
ncbi:hypothetical protein DFR67_102175 [Williamsia limnetica]|jgi:hypothetical protein|uniref:Copper(I)-binding protein n=1 Tax=Williamsia limnetica TaxID=882452 RepID=A0A318S0N2_WILLI|nr:hypothetical protein DFR67_102175 [Williamsia limnetica]